MSGQGASPTIAEYAKLPFVSLTTFRRTGVPVPTAVWIARDADALLVITPRESGKVKRLRNNPDVELAPCSRMGAVAAVAPTIGGVAHIEVDDSGRLEKIFRRKYGAEYRITMAVERLIARRHKPRVFLRITQLHSLTDQQGAAIA